MIYILILFLAILYSYVDDKDYIFLGIVDKGLQIVLRCIAILLATIFISPWGYSAPLLTLFTFHNIILFWFLFEIIYNIRSGQDIAEPFMSNPINKKLSELMSNYYIMVLKFALIIISFAALAIIYNINPNLFY